MGSDTMTGIKRYGIVEAVNSVKDSEVVNQEVDAAEKGVPNFWLHALANHELLDAEISVPDGEALKYLTDIKWLRKDDFKGFILQFCFDKNPFFQNPFLTKTYEFLDQDETILQKASGSTIRDEIIPRAVLWYLGEAVQGDKEVGSKESEESEEYVDEVREDEVSEDEVSEDEENEDEVCEDEENEDEVSEGQENEDEVSEDEENEDEDDEEEGQ
ncbi:hypothetical protein ACLB2K_044142 [Fragaria x ananassa]